METKMKKEVISYDIEDAVPESLANNCEDVVSESLADDSSCSFFFRFGFPIFLEKKHQFYNSVNEYVP